MPTGLRHNTLAAFRAELAGNATLIALVPAAKMRIGFSPTLTEFPCIVLDMDGARAGFTNTLGGMLWVTAYSDDDQPAAALFAIEAAVRSALDEKCIEIADSNISVHDIYYSFASGIVHEDEIREDVFSLAMKFEYVTESK